MLSKAFAVVCCAGATPLDAVAAGHCETALAFADAARVELALT